MQTYPDEKSNNPYHPGSHITTSEYPDKQEEDLLTGKFSSLSTADDKGESSIPPPAYSPEPDASSSSTTRGLGPGQGQFVSPAGPPPSQQQQPVYGGSYSAYPSPPGPPPQASSPDSRAIHNPFSSSSHSIPPATSSFSRPPPGHLPYNGFSPAYLISHGKHLESGFDVVPPPSRTMPHPFETHDVNEGDWTKFLGDLQRSAVLFGQNRPSSASRSSSDFQGLGGRGGFGRGFGGGPVGGGLLGGGRDRDMGRRGLGGGLVGGLIGLAVHAASSPKPSQPPPPPQQQQQQGDNIIPPNQLIDAWNQFFFHPRRMEAILARGPYMRIDSGPGPIPPLDPYIESSAPALGRRSSYGSDSSSSSSSSSGDDRYHDRRSRRASRRAEKRERRDERRAEKRLHREEMRRLRGRGSGLGAPLGQRRGRSHDGRLGEESGSGRRRDEKDRWRIFIVSV